MWNVYCCDSWYSVHTMKAYSYSSIKSVMHGPIGFICFHFNTSLCEFIGYILSQFNHLLILWTCLLQWIGRWYWLWLLVGKWYFLLLLVWRWHMLRNKRSVFADAVQQESSSQGSSCKHHYSSTHNCNPCCSTGSKGLHTTCKEKNIMASNIKHMVSRCPIVLNILPTAS